MTARTACLLACLAILPRTSRAAGGSLQSPLPLPRGDWIVQVPMVLVDVTIRLRGNLVVTETGSLDLRGVHLVMEGSSDGERTIEIRGGGRFASSPSPVTGRTTAITKGSGPGRYAFAVARDASLEIALTDVHDAGWDDEHPGVVVDGPPRIAGVARSILECDFSGNHVGLTVRGFSGAIQATRFHHNRRTGLRVQGGADRLSILEFDNQPLGLAIEEGASPYVVAPVFTANGLGLRSRDSSPEISGGFFAGNLGQATFEGLSAPSVHDNLFVASLSGVAVRGGAAPLIRDNDFDANSLALSNDGAPEVEARSNYWGAADGPSGVGPGRGDAVGKGVRFDPWCRQSCRGAAGWTTNGPAESDEARSAR